MPTRPYSRHTVSSTAPAVAQPGDEWFDSSKNKLYKYVATSGTNVGWIEISQVIPTTTTIATYPIISSLDSSTLNSTQCVIVTPTIGSVTYTLPDASTMIGKFFIIKRLTSGTVTITPYAGQFIETGASDVSFTIPAQYDSYTFVSDGINRWHVV